MDIFLYYITGCFKRFQYFDFETSFLKKKNIRYKYYD